MGTRRLWPRLLAVALAGFVAVEVNYPRLSPASQLALFALFGLLLAFLRPLRGETGEGGVPPRWRTFLLHGLPALLSAAVCLWVVVETEPVFETLWIGGRSLGDRAGAEHPADLALGALGLLLVLEAARRAVGPALSVLAAVFLAYAGLGPHLPGFLLPHRGYGVERIVSQTFLHSQGVFGIALKVMFTYVFLFLVLGALLEATGATRYLVEGSRRLFGASPGGPAKVAVLASGLMGSLSGSAVANTATTGTVTIPMMRSAGFSPAAAAGMEAAASSGGALVPPVMGAGAYMMLEIIDPPVTYLQILRAALLPALLYYLSLFLMVHFYGRRLTRQPPPTSEDPGESGSPSPREPHEAGGPAPGPSPLASARALFLRWEGLVFAAALGSLLGLLAAGFTVFRAASLSALAVVVTAAAVPRTRLGPGRFLDALTAAARGAVPLISAAAAVGVILGVVTLTGAGLRLPALILPLAESHLTLALAALMVSSLVLGMGLPSSVCYLLLAILVGPVLGELGVVPLAAHLFIFYFGMMSMVTPPVALAAYAASALAGADFWRASRAAFRFALAGFALPFLFVYRPQLLMLSPAGGPESAGNVALAVALAVLGILPLAAAVAGWLRRPLGPAARALLVASAALALFPGRGPVFGDAPVSVYNLAGIALLAAVALTSSLRHPRGAGEGLTS